MNSKILNLIAGVICFSSVSGLYSCKDTTPVDTKYIKDFHVTNFLHSANMLEEGKLALYVDYSTCIAEGMKTSALYIKLVPSFVEATKSFYSIKGDSIKPSNPQPIGFRGILLVKRQKFFYCTYSLGITETS